MSNNTMKLRAQRHITETEKVIQVRVLQTLAPRWAVSVAITIKSKKIKSKEVKRQPTSRAQNKICDFNMSKSDQGQCSLQISIASTQGRPGQKISLTDNLSPNRINDRFVNGLQKLQWLITSEAFPIYTITALDGFQSTRTRMQNAIYWGCRELH